MDNDKILQKLDELELVFGHLLELQQRNDSSKQQKFDEIKTATDRLFKEFESMELRKIMVERKTNDYMLELKEEVEKFLRLNMRLEKYEKDVHNAFEELITARNSLFSSFERGEQIPMQVFQNMKAQLKFIGSGIKQEKNSEFDIRAEIAKVKEKLNKIESNLR